MGEGGVQTPAALTASVRELRAQVQAARKAVGGVAAAARQLDVRVRQLLALRDEEPDLAERLDRLEGVLDAGRISAHVGAAVARAGIVLHPSPHAVIERLLPPDVYLAAVDAVPPSIFFNAADGQRLELAMPPVLAPTRAVVAWRFLAGAVVDAIGPAVAGLFREVIERHLQSQRAAAGGPAEGLRLTASHGRLVLRRPGYQERERRERPWHFVTTTISLAREMDSSQHGSVVCGSGSERADIPYRANVALAVFDAAGAHVYASIPATAPPDTERLSYEFPIGPDAASRRRLG